MWWLALAAGAAPTFQVDATALHQHLGARPVATGGEGLCGGPDQVLGVAAVFYSKKQMTMARGHASMRFLRCVDGAIEDVEFEYYRFSRSTEARLAADMPGEPILDDPAYLRSLRGSLFLNRNLSTVDRGHFGRELARNREIYELWLDVSTIEASDLFAQINDVWLAQWETMEARRPLTRRYIPITTNCTWHLQELLGLGPFPWAGFRALTTEDHVVRAAVLYPSHHLLIGWNRVEGSDSLIESLRHGRVEARSRPVFRRPARRADPWLASLGEALVGTPPVVFDALAEYAAADGIEQQPD